MSLPDVKRLQEKRLEAKNLEDIADKKMQEAVDKTTEQASVNPGVNKGLETVSDDAVTEALITNLENRRKDFKTRFKGKTPEEKVDELKKLLASDDEAFMEQTKEIAADLLDKKGRLTVEELLGCCIQGLWHRPTYRHPKRSKRSCIQPS